MIRRGRLDSERSPEKGEPGHEEIPWATMDMIRADLRKRGEQIVAVAESLARIAHELARLESDVSAAESLSFGGKRRRRKRGPAQAQSGPSVIEVAVEILAARGSPMQCTDLARAVLARGVNSGNNERSLRMSASKGKKLRGLAGDVIALP